MILPFNENAQGAYSFGAYTGILPAALGANSEIFQFRFVSSTRMASIRRIRISAVVSTTFFAAGVPVQIAAIKSSAWTAAGTGGTAITIGTDNRRKATMRNSDIAAGDIRIATTAALGAGTKTMETNNFAALAAPGPTGSPGQIIAPGTVLWEAKSADGDHPFLLANQEGFSIRSIAVPITGTWTCGIDVDWVELIDSYTPSAV